MSRELLPDDVYFAGLPKKGCGTAALLFDEAGRLLIVDPNYKPGWGLPGGVVDIDESPREAAIREVREELGLEIPDMRMLCVDYLVTDPPRGEAFYFIFDGGVLSQEQQAAITLQTEELDAYRFVEAVEALTLLNPRQAGRLTACLNARNTGHTLYLEGGRPVEL